MQRLAEGWHKANRALDSLLYTLCVVVVPAALAAFSIIALVAWDGSYRSTGGVPLEFRVVEATGEGLEPADALQRLRESAPVEHHDTKLSERPFWFLFALRPQPGGKPLTAEFPSRHASRLACWDAATLAPLGSATRAGAEGLIPVKAGFAFGPEIVRAGDHVLCQGTFAGPARISVAQWDERDLAASSKDFHRSAGLLDGGLIVLALFVLTTAIINREWLYVLFAAWLLANLRVAALSAGWDTQWLGRSIPADWMLMSRKASMALYYILTVILFARLFKDDLKRVGYAPLLKGAQWSCVPLLLAIALPYSRFLPLLWVSTALSIGVLVFLLARILLVTRSKVAVWYALSLGITLTASLYEVISAALGLKGLIGAVNSVTAALSSSLIAALAIAQQMREERLERMKAQAELRNAYEAIPLGLFTLNAQGLFTQTNPALRSMLGIGPRREHWADYFEPGSWGMLQELIGSSGLNEIEIRSMPRQGTEQKWFLVKATLAKERIEGSLQDITERVKATERLRFYAEHDALTDILNRRGIEKLLAEAISAAGRGTPLSLAYLDLDRFKLINDLFGHMAGDAVLRQVCDRIKEMLHEGQAIGRVGGDEFVVVFQGTPIRSAAWLCRGITERIGTVPYQTGDRAFQVKCSIGLIEVAPGVKVTDAISMADRACREAKGGHHGNPVVYEKHAPVFAEREQELRLVERLADSAAPEGLFLVMQPIMSLHAPYDSLDFEVLVRMREADNSVTPAYKLIAAAEASGRVGVVDRWVLSNTLKWLETNNDRLTKTRFVCVNLSGGSLNDEKFVQDAFAMLRESSRMAGRLCIEITESVALHDLENTRRFIDKMREFGARIALDDFGAGYTSFSYLKELPADAVKIDGAFVRGVHRHPANLAIVEAVVAVARNLGMRSIAEWAEDCGTLRALSGVGVDYVQGFAIAKPQDPDAILKAESAADFIQDPEVAAFVRGSLGVTPELWEEIRGASRARVH